MLSKMWSEWNAHVLIVAIDLKLSNHSGKIIRQFLSKLQPYLQSSQQLYSKVFIQDKCKQRLELKYL